MNNHNGLHLTCHSAIIQAGTDLAVVVGDGDGAVVVAVAAAADDEQQHHFGFLDW